MLRFLMFLGVLCVAGVVMLWSVTPVLVKIALTYVDPFTLAFLRLILGSLVLTIVFKIRRHSLRSLFRKDIWILIGGAAIGVNYIFYIASLNYTTAGMGGLIIQCQFVFLAILAALVLKERVTAIKIVGMAAIIAGVAIIYVTRFDLSTIVNRRYAFGNSIMLISGLGWGSYALANKAVVHRLGSLHILVPMLFIATAISAAATAFGFEARMPLDAGGLAAILILGAICTGGSFVLMSEGLRRLSASSAGPFTAVTPLINLLLARAILDESITTAMIFSAILVASGVIAVGVAEWRSSK